jgi:hypothetical protein
MVKTKDNRNFFTHEKYYPQLIEFSKTFGAEISVVKVADVEVLDLVQLAPAICDDKPCQTLPDVEIIETKIPNVKRQRNKLLENSKNIQSYIEDLFRKGEIVRLQSLIKRYKRLQITSACLCNHMRIVREKLQSEGLVIKKIGGGEYQVQTAEKT